MKKKQIFVIGLFMCLSLILGACTSSSPSYMEEAAEAPMAGTIMELTTAIPWWSKRR